jgi:thiol-disulfide isomerase/thioredoxin
MSNLLIHLFISIGLIVLLGLIYLLVKQQSLHIASKPGRRLINANLNRKVIVYFTTPDCVACRMAQKPALDQLKAMLQDELEVIEINAYEKPEIAKEWGVLSVPATFVLDEKGNPVAVNFGVTPFSKLLKQLQREKEKTKRKVLYGAR